jgi:deoxycytidylate deaminase
MKKNIDKIYENRGEFIIIGLTGKTGSGCSTVAEILENGYKNYNTVDYTTSDIQNRKASIIKKFASENFIENDKKFKIIKPSTILMMLFLFDNKIIIEKITVLNNFLNMKENDIDNYKNKSKKLEENKKEYIKDLNKELKDLKNLINVIRLFKANSNVFNDFFTFILGFNENIIEKKEKIKDEIINTKKKYDEKIKNETGEIIKKEFFGLLKYDLKEKGFSNYEILKNITKDELSKKINLKRELFNDVLKEFSKLKSKDFIDLYEKYNNLIQEKRKSKELTIKSLQLIGDLVREHIDIFQLPNYCNYLIKAYRNESKKENKSCYIVIDSLKNPFEIIYFKERFSAYYTFSIHSKDEIIFKRLETIGMKYLEIDAIHKKELNTDEKDKQRGSLDSNKDFNSQNIIECIQRSDIYIDNNKDKKDTLYKQIFRYLSLIVHPGLITPSKDEMVMQLALNAKFNSGCISRQVGAVVLNKYGSLKSIGWNEVPEGQMPCLLRSHSELLNNSSSVIYSKYEKEKVRNENSFKYIFTKENPNNQYEESNKKGLNDSFCFKSIQNKIDDNKNQVYTRFLHAEENAFLQASKYGNSEIIGGQLFTTASPCFLCAKKAYQLGMKRIVYIEAYPDISNEQVFDIGTNEIEMVHFRGAIGLAYQKLYEPIFSYKDELNALNKK